MAADDVSFPAVILLMGVSGSGKSTIGAALAQKLGWPYAPFEIPADVYADWDAKVAGQAAEAAWDAAFADYAAERTERMRRLRFCASLTSIIDAEFIPAGTDLGVLQPVK